MKRKMAALLGITLMCSGMVATPVLAEDSTVEENPSSEVVELEMTENSEEEVLEEETAEETTTIDSVEVDSEGEEVSTLASESIRSVDTNQDQVTAFVTRLYQYCLNREPEEGGLRNWVNYINNGGTGITVASGFFHSQEFKNRNLTNSEIVTIAYKTFLNRDPDSSGLTNWVNALDKGASIDYIVHGVGMSQEFANICAQYGINRGSYELTQARDKNLNVTAFVTRNYKELLGRNPDEGGLENWCNIILNSNSDSQQETARNITKDGFIHSQEFKNRNLSNEDFVKVLYRTFLNRDGGPSEISFWANKLNTGTSRDDVVYGFAYSQEFTNFLDGSGLTNKKVVTQTYSNGVAGAYYVGDIQVGSFSAHCYEDRNPNEWMAQKIVDASNSAYVLDLGISLTYPNGFTIIADHASQGFQAFMYANTLTFAGRTYTKVSQYSAHTNSDKDIILSNGKSYTDQYDGVICTYTCTNNSGARSVAYWR